MRVVRSCLKTGPAGAHKIALDITAGDLINFLFTVPVQWSYMTDLACSNFTLLSPSAVMFELFTKCII